MLSISIITPSYNQGRFIERTIKSVANQGLDEIEHLVMDGGSVDETIAILKRSNNISWLSEKDRGQAHAFNKGVQASKGEIIGWLNSDDIYYDHAIRRVIDLFECNPKIDVIYGMADHIDTEDNPFEEYPTEEWTKERILKNCFICQPAAFVRRSVFNRYGLLNESLNYCMDYEYWIRLSIAGAAFHYVEYKLAGSRLYPDNKTLGKRQDVHKEINHMLVEKIGYVPSSWILSYAHTTIENPKYNNHSLFRRRVKLILEATRASLHWNGRITFELIGYFSNWLIPNIIRRMVK